MTYEYKCNRCGEEYFIRRAISLGPVESFVHQGCPQAVEDGYQMGPFGVFQLQVSGGVGTIFTGGGWTPKSGE